MIADMNGQPHRDDLPPRVKDELARRAGYRCSMPTCRAPTSGPSDTRASGASNVGVAAHITAASPGGPRYDEQLSSQERQVFDNGIWLCQNHAKMIDDDEIRYTRDLLIDWRGAAEERAREEQGLPMLRVSGGSRRLVAHRRTLGPDQAELREGVHDFLVDVGAPYAWGDHYELVRMVLYELALNSVEHGGTQAVELESRAGMVTIRDQGQRFGVDDLRAGGEGGYQSITDLETDAAGTFALMYRFARGFNEWCVVDQIVSDGANTPCGILAPGLGRNELEFVASEVRRLTDCPEVHLYPGRLWSYSDWGPVLRRLEAELGGRRLIVHGVRHNSQMARLILRHVPGAGLPD